MSALVTNGLLDCVFQAGHPGHADLRGRDRLVEWQLAHRRGGPYPLRHNGTNVHVGSAGETESTFRSYIFVTQILDHKVSNVSSCA
jgi:hypothetical protein